jgi:CheY-like chemotaxis protein
MIRKVLIADDDAINQRRMQTLLEAAGYRVLGLSVPERLLATCQAFQPHLLLINVGLASADDYYLCRQLRHTEQAVNLSIGKSLPILLCFRENDPIDPGQAHQAGVTRCVAQTNDPKSVLKVVQELLRDDPITPFTLATSLSTPPSAAAVSSVIEDPLVNNSLLNHPGMNDVPTNPSPMLTNSFDYVPNTTFEPTKEILNTTTETVMEVASVENLETAAELITKTTTDSLTVSPSTLEAVVDLEKKPVNADASDAGTFQRLETNAAAVALPSSGSLSAMVAANLPTAPNPIWDVPVGPTAEGLVEPTLETLVDDAVEDHNDLENNEANVDKQEIPQLHNSETPIVIEVGTTELEVVEEEEIELEPINSDLADENLPEPENESKNSKNYVDLGKFEIRYHTGKLEALVLKGNKGHNSLATPDSSSSKASAVNNSSANIAISDSTATNNGAASEPTANSGGSGNDWEQEINTSYFQSYLNLAATESEEEKLRFIPCPACGAATLLSDIFCVACGTVIDEVSA